MHSASDFGYSIAGQLPSTNAPALPPETLISIDGETPITLAAFYADNEFADHEIAAIEDDLTGGGFVIFGGGAGAEFIVRLVQSAA